MILNVNYYLKANIFNLIVFIIKAFIINLKFGFYIRLLYIKVYVFVFVRELIKVIYLSLVLYI